ncbi:hypothetical protein D3C79_938460 [compost metagenome]
MARDTLPATRVGRLPIRSLSGMRRNISTSTKAPITPLLTPSQVPAANSPPARARISATVQFRLKVQ